jgi:hypothetical protein
MADGTLTAASTLSAASEILTAASAGYQPANDQQTGAWPSEMVRVFEDAFTVVAVCVFDTWRALEDGWEEAQSVLVEMISEHLTDRDAKAWDGYLVLLTPGARDEDRDAIDRIRYDTARVRKLVASAPELATVKDIKQTLLSLLPLGSDEELTATRDPLELLADALRVEFDEPIVEALLSAFAEQRPLVEALDKIRSGDR